MPVPLQLVLDPLESEALCCALCCFGHPLQQSLRLHGQSHEAAGHECDECCADTKQTHRDMTGNQARDIEI